MAAGSGRRTRQRRRRGTARAANAHRGWPIAAFAVALLVSLPMLSVVWLALRPEENIWPHLVATVLGSYVANTLVLMTGVALGTALIASAPPGT